jgi:hypothetical protein
MRYAVLKRSVHQAVRCGEEAAYKGTDVRPIPDLNVGDRRANISSRRQRALGIVALLR